MRLGKSWRQPIFVVVLFNYNSRQAIFGGNNRHPMNLIYYLFNEITRMSYIVVEMRGW